MNMLASAGINPNDSDIEFEPEDERRYKKKTSQEVDQVQRQAQKTLRA